MADTERAEATPTPQLSNTEFATALAQAFAATQGPKKVTIGEYQRRHARKVKLTRQYTDNGYLLELHQLTDDQVKYLNKIHRSGLYLKGKVQVVVEHEAQPHEQQAVHIRYSNATPDQRTEMSRLFRDFTDLVRQINDEQDVLDENEQIDKEWLAERRTSAKAAK